MDSGFFFSSVLLSISYRLRVGRSKTFHRLPYGFYRGAFIDRSLEHASATFSRAGGGPCVPSRARSAPAHRQEPSCQVRRRETKRRPRHPVPPSDPPAWQRLGISGCLQNTPISTAAVSKKQKNLPRSIALSTLGRIQLGRYYHFTKYGARRSRSCTTTAGRLLWPTARIAEPVAEAPNGRRDWSGKGRRKIFDRSRSLTLAAQRSRCAPTTGSPGCDHPNNKPVRSMRQAGGTHRRVKKPRPLYRGPAPTARRLRTRRSNIAGNYLAPRDRLPGNLRLVGEAHVKGVPSQGFTRALAWLACRVSQFAAVL
ncbi:hypothetical protein GGR56DRAFT_480135 [Xylariaceae sp. FL0804]|nr:hypothetical protein GGR56DRAFT_480135 [Xylariaceae sp. FL0804]